MVDLLFNGMFLLSAGGFFLYLNRRWDISMAFVPALYCSGWVCVLFVAGILNFMLETTVAVTALGVVCFCVYAKQIPRLPGREWGFLAIYAAALLFLLAILGKTFLTNYDVYSHWGVVVRQMLLNDRVPSLSDPVVNFKSYPLGSSLWIYYFCKVNRFGDGMFAFAQQVMQVSFLLPAAAWVKKENRYLAFLPAAYVLYAMTGNVSVNNLQVDSLMPILAAAVFAVAAYYRCAPRKAILCAAPLLVTLLQVKSSAVFFAGVYWLWALWYWRGAWKENKPLAASFAIGNVGIPLAGMAVWMRHVSLVFGDDITNKHAVNLENYTYTFQEKTAQDIRLVVDGALRAAFRPDNGTFWLLLVVTAGLLLLWSSGRLRGEPSGSWLALALADWAVFAAYLAGITGMYLFSMPLGEAVRLASFDRYFQSCGIFLYGLNGFCLLALWKNTRRMRGGGLPYGFAWRLRCFPSGTRKREPIASRRQPRNW